jgi:CHAT domain-containing protein
MCTYWDDTRDEFAWRSEWSPVEIAAKQLWRAVYELILSRNVERCAQHSIKHLVISPDGPLTAIPFHLLVDSDGRRLDDKLAVSYQPNLTGLLTLLDRDQLDTAQMKAVIVADPSRSVSHAQWECEQVAAQVAARVGSAATVLTPDLASIDGVTRACVGAGMLHFTGHAAFDWQSPDSAFLTLADGVEMGLVDIEKLTFAPGALVFLSACHTGRRGAAASRTTSRGLVDSMFEAGAATVICTLWPVDSLAAALVSYWFYQGWLNTDQKRLDSLRSATQRLRTATRAECEQVLGRRIYKRGERPFADECYWGAFVLYGAW